MAKIEEKLPEPLPVENKAPARLEEHVGRVVGTGSIIANGEVVSRVVMWRGEGGRWPSLFYATAAQFETAKELQGELARLVIVQPGDGSPPRLLTLESATSPPKLYDKAAAKEEVLEKWHDLLHLLAQ